MLRGPTPWVRRLVALTMAFALAAVFSSSAFADLSWSTPCSSDLDVATCERVTWIANELNSGQNGGDVYSLAFDIRWAVAISVGVALFVGVVGFARGFFRDGG